MDIRNCASFFGIGGPGRTTRTTSIGCLGLLGALAGCAVAPGATSIPDAATFAVTPDQSVSATPADLQVAGAFTVHEWGTFTSVTGSSGGQMEGLHHEEEALPTFVHSRAIELMSVGKGYDGLPAGVTQKMETPVLYFYAPETPHVKVTVDFPQGIISQWFPKSASYLPDFYSNHGIAGGRMTWEADLVAGLADFPTVLPSDIWAPSRKVASVPVQVGAEHEQFIFYRGLGAFTMPLVATTQKDNTISVRNDSLDKISAVFLLRYHQGGGAVVNLGPIDGGKTLTNILAPAGGKEFNPDLYVADASSQIAAALVQSGLYPDEAQAMVGTWSKSYFLTFGTRLLYIVPRAWTDTVLPIHIDPQPAKLVRTLVGRIETLTTADEAELVTLVNSAATSNMVAATLINQLGRLAEPKLRRTLELLTDPAAKTYCAKVVAQAAISP